jgi:hypothetical protein
MVLANENLLLRHILLDVIKVHSQFFKFQLLFLDSCFL